MLNTEYGIVCASCSKYFKKEEACECCGLLSKRLSRIKRFNDNLKRCDRCSKIDYGTCKSCKHYRQIITTVDGKKCAKCCDGKSKRCLNCNISIPSGRGDQCIDCYWMKLMNKRVQINLELFENNKLRSSFHQYSKWLGKNKSYKKAAMVIAKQTLFFSQVELYFGDFPKYKALLKYFGADSLRRHKSIIEWLQIEKSISINEIEKKEIIEEQRIKKMLLRLPIGSIGHLVLQKYTNDLRKKFHKKNVVRRTIRLSLTPAIEIMKLSVSNKNGLPNSEEVKKYLSTHPGQRSSLSSFLSFLFREYKIKINGLDKNALKINRRSYLEKKLVDLSNKEWKDNDKLSWCKLSLEFFHEVKVPKLVIEESIKLSTENDEGVSLRIDDLTYFIPLPTSQISFT
jgi:hypothetical protein